MSRILGIGAGVVIAVYAFLAFRYAAGGLAQEQTDVGLWFGIIGSFLAIAAAVTVVGTLLHTSSRT